MEEPARNIRSLPEGFAIGDFISASRPGPSTCIYLPQISPRAKLNSNSSPRILVSGVTQHKRPRSGRIHTQFPVTIERTSSRGLTRTCRAYPYPHQVSVNSPKHNVKLDFSLLDSPAEISALRLEATTERYFIRKLYGCHNPRITAI